MNLIQRIALALNRNNYEYIKKELEKANSDDVTEIIDKMNPSLIDFELIKLAIDKRYRFSKNTPKSIKYNRNFIEYYLNHCDQSDLTEFINNSEEVMLDDELFNIVVKRYDYHFNVLDDKTPSFITFNPSYMARMFVEYIINNDYEYVGNILDSFKKYLSYSIKDNNKVIIYDSINLDELVMYIEKYLCNKIDEQYDNEEIYKNEVISNNKTCLKHAIELLKEKYQENKFDKSKIRGFVITLIKYANPDCIDVRMIKDAISIGYNGYHCSEELMLKDDDILIELLFLNYNLIYYVAKNKSENEIDKIVYKAIDQGKKISNAYEIKEYYKYKRNDGNKIFIYAYRKGDFDALDYINTYNLNESEQKELDEIVYHEIDSGYKINYKSPTFMKEFKYLEYALNNSKNIYDYYSIIFAFSNNLYDKRVLEYIKNKKFTYEQQVEFENLVLEFSNYLDNENDEILIFGLNYGYSFDLNTPKQYDIVKLVNKKQILNKVPSNIYEYILKHDDLFKDIIGLIRINDLINMINNKLFDENKLTNEQRKVLNYINKYNKIIDFIGYYELNRVYDEYLKNDNLCLELFQFNEYKILYSIIFKDKNEVMLKKLSDKQIAFIKNYCNIQDDTLKREYEAYIKNNINELTVNKINILRDLMDKFETSQSKALYTMRKILCNSLSNLDNPLKGFDDLEKIFTTNNLPFFAKMYLSFKIIYPEFQYIYVPGHISLVHEIYSPMLLNNNLNDLNVLNFVKYLNNPTSNDIHLILIYNDILRNFVHTNNTNLRQYLDNLELGNYLFLQLVGENIKHNNKFDSLSNEIKEQSLRDFANHLEYIYQNSKEGKNDKNDLANLNYIEKLKYLRDKIKPTNKYDLPDRIVRMFGITAGFTSFKQIREEMNNVIVLAHNRNIKLGEYLENQPFIFKDGDFVRCIGDFNAFAGSSEYGNYSNEHLTMITNTFSSDDTRFDIDFSQVKGLGSIYNLIDKTFAKIAKGNIYFIVKKDNQSFNRSKDENSKLTNNKYDPSKIEFYEIFDGHFGARTGMSLTDVDVILYGDFYSINSLNPYDEDGNVNYLDNRFSFDDLSRIKFEIVRHGYYIPIIDFSGKLIFTVTEYEKLRSKMNGLSYYEIDEYEISNNLDFNGIDNIISKLDDNRIDTVEKRNKVYDILKVILSGYNLSLKTKIDGDLTPGSVEVIDTGSTGRETNNIGSGDFDLLIRVDQVICRDSNKYRQFKESFKNYFETKYKIDEIVTTDNGDYRMKGVHIDDNTIVDIDLSFTVKTDKITYSTDECLKDRLNTIKEQDYDKYQKILANIIIAKKFMKKYACYKPYRSDNTQGGMGGSGIENWILQNGGSFIDAIKDFYEVAKDKDYKEFRKEYFVWDFGQNHFAERKGIYQYDNFIDNMSDTGYNKMKNACKEILLNIDNIYDLLNDNKDISKIA